MSQDTDPTIIDALQSLTQESVFDVGLSLFVQVDVYCIGHILPAYLPPHEHMVTVCLAKVPPELVAKLIGVQPRYKLNGVRIESDITVLCLRQRGHELWPPTTDDAEELKDAREAANIPDQIEAGHKLMQRYGQIMKGQYEASTAALITATKPRDDATSTSEYGPVPELPPDCLTGILAVWE